MKRRVILASMMLVALIGCSKKADKPQIAGWAENTAEKQILGFRYPQGWMMVQDGSGRYTVYSSQEVVERFYDYTVRGIDGARLTVSLEKMDTLKTLDETINRMKNDLSGSGFDISEVIAKPIQGVPGMQVHFSGFVDAKNKLEALEAVAVKDSFLCTIKYEAFNKFFPAYQMVFDSALATFRFPVSAKDMKPEDLAKVSDKFKPFENNLLKISMPDNFEPSFPQVKAPVEFSMEIKGYRQDSFIRIDILPAQKLALEKVVEQNAKFFQKELSRGEGTVGGFKSVFINYSPAKGINSRVYFAVNNDKIYRIIFNYFAEMKSGYLPAFEKTIGSLAIK
jgi:hypothetical protein